MKYITVFLSANELEEKYTQPAKEFAQLMVANGYGLVWGGSDVGLMKVVSDGVKEAGGKLVGVTMKLIKDSSREDADELIVADTLGERKKTMVERADAFVVMVGGIGTLDEVTEVLELKKHNVVTKPIVILNTENFYEGLKVQMQKMKDEGFIKRELNDMVFFADTPEEAMEYITQSK